MAHRYTLTNKHTGRPLGTVESTSLQAAVAGYLSEHPDSGLSPGDIRAQRMVDTAIAREVESRAEVIRLAMVAGVDGELPGGSMQPLAADATLAITLAGETVGAFVLESLEDGGRGRGHGLLFGHVSWRAAVKYAMCICCSRENLAGCPGAYFTGGVFVPAARRSGVADALSVVDGFCASWKRARGPLVDIVPRESD
jgi:hypothetical protein